MIRKGRSLEVGELWSLIWSSATRFDLPINEPLFEVALHAETKPGRTSTSRALVGLQRPRCRNTSKRLHEADGYVEIEDCIQTLMVHP